MPRAPKTGGDVDSWCTKCRLMLTHRIVAMVGSKPVRVECQTCHSQHNFRARPPGEVAPKAAGAARVAGPTKAPRVTSASKLEQERREREQSWQRAVSGRLVSDFLKYNVKGTFQVGDLVKHSKFGDGVVTRVIDAHKIEILFRDEPRTLAQALA